MSDLLPLIKIIAVFCVIILLMRRKLNIGIALLIGSVLVGILYAMPADKIVASAVQATLDSKTVILALMILFISVFNNSLKISGRLEKLTSSFSSVIPSKRLNLIFFPGIIAFLPMPGGAYFSAPLVREAAKDLSLSASRQAAINYWFRHVWEFTWPLYPDFLWIIQTYGFSIAFFISRMFPFTLVAMISGIIVLLRGLPHVGWKRVGRKELAAFARSIFPFALLFALVPVFDLALQIMQRNFQQTFPANLSFLLAIGLSMVFWWIRDRFSGRQIRSLLLSRETGQLILIIWGVMVFQSMLVHSNSAQDIGHALSRLGIPLVALIVLLPLSVGTVMGYTLSTLSSTFPILMAAAGLSVSSPDFLPMVMLGFVSGFFGTMISPVHSCFFLTKEYFQADWSQLYRYVILAYLPVLVCAVSLYLWLVR